MYHEMLFLMRMCSPLPNYILMRALNSEPISRYYPIYFLAQTLALGKHKCMILVCVLHYLLTVYQVPPVICSLQVKIPIKMMVT